MPTAEINGFTAHYVAKGGGPPVVYVHGGFASLGRTFFDTQADDDWDWEHFFAERFTMITFGRRGCERSSLPRDNDGYDFESQARDLQALLDHLGLESAHVIGSSAGGPIAMTFAAGHKDRLRSLTLVGTGHRLFRPSMDEIDSLVADHIRILEEEGAEMAFEKRPVDVWFESLWRRRDVELRGELTEFEEAEAELSRRAAGVPRHLRIDYYAAELRNLAVYFGDTSEVAGRIEAPTLVVHGEEDRVVPPEWGRDLARSIPEARFLMIPRAPHTLMRFSEEAREVVMDFIEEVDAAVGGRRS